MKNLLNSVTIIVLLNTIFYTEANSSLESRIRTIDEQIRKEEQQHSHNTKKLQELVAEYNKLVQEQASSVEKKSAPTSNNVEQTHEEAIVQRLKEHERRIDELEKIIAALTGNKNTDLSTSASLSPSDTTKDQTLSTSTTSTTATTGIAARHAIANLATEQAEMESTTPTLDTKSPALTQFNQAMALFNAGIKTGSKIDLKNAAEAFELITTTYPDETYANKSFVHAGDAHLKLGNIDSAQKCYKMAITKPLNSQNAIRARLGYGETLMAKNNKDAACSQIKVLSKEILDEEQKKRFDALQMAASCLKDQVKTD